MVRRLVAQHIQLAFSLASNCSVTLLLGWWERRFLCLASQTSFGSRGQPPARRWRKAAPVRSSGKLLVCCHVSYRKTLPVVHDGAALHVKRTRVMHACAQCLDVGWLGYTVLASTL
jgi:hypothetical protein